MKVLICGSRNIESESKVFDAIRHSEFEVTEVISGGASGVDYIAELYARLYQEIPLHLYKPDWNKHGKKAGVLRNIEMVNAADAVIAIWDGKSRGTLSTINYAKKCGKPLYVETV